jgi:outer membrane immunogenic protein
MKYKLMIGAALVAASAPAYAQDVSGFRVEGRASWDRSGSDFIFPNPDFDEDDEDSEEFLTGSDKRSDVTFGGELGYDFQIGSSFVLGAYAGADFSSGSACVELVEDDMACSGLDRTLTVGARAGVPIGGSSLIYVKGGYSNGKLDVAYDPDLTDNDDDEPGDVFEFSETLSGYHAGGGIEVGITPSVYVKAEYLYTDYGSRDFGIGTAATAPLLTVATDRHQVFAGIGLRF